MLKVNESNGKLVLANVNEAIVRLLIVTKVYSMFSLQPTLEEAVNFITENK